jgi:hypothetical protein
MIEREQRPRRRVESTAATKAKGSTRAALWMSALPHNLESTNYSGKSESVLELFNSPGSVAVRVRLGDAEKNHGSRSKRDEHNLGSKSPDFFYSNRP